MLTEEEPARLGQTTESTEGEPDTETEQEPESISDEEPIEKPVAKNQGRRYPLRK